MKTAIFRLAHDLYDRRELALLGFYAGMTLVASAVGVGVLVGLAIRVAVRVSGL